MTSPREVSVLILTAFLLAMPALHAESFTIEQVLSAPFASGLVAAPTGRSFAWVSNARGRRNVWLALAGTRTASFTAHALTHYEADDGVDVTDLAFVPNHDELLFVRGGDFENPDKAAPNPAQIAAGVAQEIYLVDFRGGTPVKLGEGHAPIASPSGDRVLYLHEGKVFSVAPRKGAKAEQLFMARGVIDSLRFSPDGTRLAFVSNRGDHSFIGVYTFAHQTLRWLDANMSLDFDPRWSPDGTRVAFLRVPPTHEEISIVPHRTGDPWSIRVANLAAQSVIEVYRAPLGAGSVFHALSSDAQLVWSGEHLVFPAENDGWLHFYSVPAAGGEARLLTPGPFEIEYASASADGATIVYAGNAGDMDRRHLWRLRPANGSLEPLTSGAGIETEPAVLGDGTTVAFVRADARISAHAALVEPGKSPVDFMAEGLPPEFPTAQLVVPQAIELPQRAGISAHADLFLPPSNRSGERHPAVIFVHGGATRQMLLGWHYMDYYSNAYGMNQYLASHGYLVLSLNYRCGIGYGLDFREAPHSGAAGASEYNDLIAAADYLRARLDVDPARLGLWGGSYGGYLTALGLARNSDLFRVGVDLHGVSDWHHWTLATIYNNRPLYVLDNPPAAVATALAASPIGSISGWRSPVLLISGDDDRNVAFSEQVRLADALRRQGVDYSQLILPDEIHDFLRHESWLRAYSATAQFLESRLAPGMVR